MNQHIFLWRHIVNGRRTSNALEFCYLTNIPISKCGVVGVFFTLISKWCFFFSSDSIPIWKRNKLFVGMLKCVVELPFFIQVDIFFFFFLSKITLYLSISTVCFTTRVVIGKWFASISLLRQLDAICLMMRPCRRIWVFTFSEGVSKYISIFM